MKICSTYILNVCVFIYIYIYIIHTHSAYTYIMLTKTFIWHAINRDYSFDSTSINYIQILQSSVMIDSMWAC